VGKRKVPIQGVQSSTYCIGTYLPAYLPTYVLTSIIGPLRVYYKGLLILKKQEQDFRRRNESLHNRGGDKASQGSQPMIGLLDMIPIQKRGPGVGSAALRPVLTVRAPPPRTKYVRGTERRKGGNNFLVLGQSGKPVFLPMQVYLYQLCLTVRSSFCSFV
jgi:hypothetical protein